MSTTYSDVSDMEFWEAESYHQKYLEKRSGVDSSKGSLEPFRCYGDRIAYCEGHDPNNLECTCIDDDQVRRLEQQLRGLY